MKKKQPSQEEMQCALRNQLSDMAKSAEFIRLQEMLEGINFFELCGMNNQETKHSYFLLNLFDVKGKHGWGDAFAREFFKKANLPLTDAFYKDLKTDSIRREYQFAKGDGQVDLLLFADQTVVLIENKVDSTESDNQLAKYENGIEIDERFKDYQFHHIFLTKAGQPPKTGKKKWIPVSYGDVIDAILEAQKQMGSGKEAEEYKIILEHYIKLLRRKIIMNITDLDKETKALYLQLKKDFPEAIDFLSKPFVEDIYVFIKNKIAEILQEESCSRKLHPKDGGGWIVGTKGIRLQFQTQKMDEIIHKISNGSPNPFLYEISNDGSIGGKKIIKAYAHPYDADKNDPAYRRVRELCGEYEKRNKRPVRIGKESHVLELYGYASINLYDIYEKMNSGSEDEAKLGEQILRNFVISVLDEIETIETEIEKMI